MEYKNNGNACFYIAAYFNKVDGIVWDVIFRKLTFFVADNIASRKRPFFSWICGLRELESRKYLKISSRKICSCFPVKLSIFDCLAWSYWKSLQGWTLISTCRSIIRDNIHSYLITVYRLYLSLIHIWRCRRSTLCRSRWSPYH